MRAGRLLLPVLLLPVLLFSCSPESLEDAGGESVYKIAVVMPQERQEEWERIADWALENIADAQAGLPRRVALSIEWHDENSSEIASRLKEAASDESYVAIVGPYTSAKANTAAQICSKSGKTLILPVATSAELQRTYAGKPNIWNLTQSDISQCELMLAQAVISESSSVSLLTTDDDYGRSFSDWFAYQAVELGLSVEDVFVCSSESEVRAAVRTIAEGRGYSRHLLLAPSRESFAIAFDEELGVLKESTERFRFPNVICSDVMRSPTLSDRLVAMSYEGLSPSAAPVSGFAEAYRARFGEEPSNGAAHLYDALLLLSYALTVDEGDLDDAILKVVEGRESWNRSWLPADMHDTFARLQNGGNPDVSGVTGDWTFDDRHHSGVLNTTYSHWILRNGTYSTLEYLSSDGGSRTTSSLQAWDIRSRIRQDFDSGQKSLPYPEYSGENWAVVVGTSDTWANYRHQADALAMYQLLKRHGYDDEHIILVIADNIAYDSHNLYPGTVRVRPDGENVYEGAVVDYNLKDIKVSDLRQIMTGQRSDRLSEVISPESNDNVLVFWCGHGAKNSLMWGSESAVKGYEIASIVKSMNFRKMLWVVDACYSGTIGEACAGIPGMLVITSANADEPSKADVKDPEMGIWLSNGFTREFQEIMDAQPDIVLRDLYYALSAHTLGSHATVYNVENYGNMYKESMSEYFQTNQ